MECPYCRHLNQAHDHRCQRCGRRLDRAFLAWQAEPVEPLPPAPPPAMPPPAMQSTPADLSPASVARTSTAQAQSAADRYYAATPASIHQPIQRQRVYLRTEGPVNPTPSVANDPILFCPMRVAGRMHRFWAATLDGLVVLAAVIVFTGLFFFWTGIVTPTPAHVIALLLTFMLSGLFYRLMFAMVGRESVGMQLTRLRLVNFEGNNPTSAQHLIRVAGIVASVLPLGLGIVWALFDEERLAWQDYISGTFPTVDEDSATAA